MELKALHRYKKLHGYKKATFKYKSYIGIKKASYMKKTKKQQKKDY